MAFTLVECSLDIENTGDLGPYEYLMNINDQIST